MAITASDIREHFPEFDGVSDTVIDRWLAQANRRVNATQWGEKADDAVLWLTAHLLAVTGSLACGVSPGSGAISSHRVGDLAVTYKVPDKMAQTFLASTAYGQYYLTLKTGVWPTRVLGTCDASAGY